MAGRVMQQYSFLLMHFCSFWWVQGQPVVQGLQGESADGRDEG